MNRRFMRNAFAPGLFVLCLLCPSLSFAEQPPPVELVQAGPSIIVNSNMAVLEDPKQVLTPEEILTPEVQQRFALNKEGKHNFGFSRSAWWFHLKLTNPGGAQERVLSTSYPMTGSVELFRQENGKLVKQGKAGIFYPFSEWAMYFVNPAFMLTAPQNGTGDFYVRVRSNWTMELQFTLATPSAFQEYRTTSHGIMLAIVGAWGVMIVYNLFLLISLRDRNYLIYLLENVFTFLAALSSKGATFQYIYPASQYWAFHGLQLFVSLFQLFIALFTISFVETRRTAPLTHRITVWYCYYAVLVVCLVFVYPDELTKARIAFMNIQVVSIAVYTPLIEASIRGSRQARIMLAATLCPVVGSVAYEAGVTGYMNGNILTENGAILGWLFEMLILSLALADRVKTLQAEKAAAQQTALEHERIALATAVEARDTLEAKVAERTVELEESEARFRSLAEAPSEAIFIHDNGVALDMNGMMELMTGWRRNDLIGKNTLELVIAPESLEEVRRRIGERSEHPYEAVLLKKDGTSFPAEIRGSQITYQGKAARVVSIRDLTERKAAESQLILAKKQAEDATKLKDKFVSLVSHDLRSPIASLAMALETLKSDTSLNERSRNMLEKLAVHARSQLTLISRLLDISRLQTGKLTPRKRLISCRVFVDECVSPFAFHIEQKKITIHNALPESMRLMADPTLFGECVKNIISNAIKFSNSGGAITVYQPEGRDGTIAIRDNGVGIPKHLLPNLFKHEVRTTMPGTQGEKGTGLGLPYSNDIMKAHGGAISVEQKEGEGTTFYLTLPMLNIFVLVVDDQPAQRGIVRDILIPLKAEFLEAEHGREALEILSDTKPHLIITDINMPVMDGLTLIRELRQTPAHKDIRLIAITASDGHSPEAASGFKSELFRMGVDDFIAKPQLATDLLPRAEQLLSVR